MFFSCTTARPPSRPPELRPSPCLRPPSRPGRAAPRGALGPAPNFSRALLQTCAVKNFHDPAVLSKVSQLLLDVGERSYKCTTWRAKGTVSFKSPVMTLNPAGKTQQEFEGRNFFLLLLTLDSFRSLAPVIKCLEERLADQLHKQHLTPEQEHVLNTQQITSRLWKGSRGDMFLKVKITEAARCFSTEGQLVPFDHFKELRRPVKIQLCLDVEHAYIRTQEESDKEDGASYGLTLLATDLRWLADDKKTVSNPFVDEN